MLSGSNHDRIGDNDSITTHEDNLNIGSNSNALNISKFVSILASLRIVTKQKQ
jgi:hypothetical protein